MNHIAPFDDTHWKQRIAAYRQTLAGQVATKAPLPMETEEVTHRREKFHEHVYVLKKPLPDKPLPDAIIYEFEKHEGNRDYNPTGEALRWQNILKYLDYDDVFYPDAMIRPFHQIRRRAYYALQASVYGQSELLGNERIAINGIYGRNTEFEAIYNCLEVALQNYQQVRLTKSQKETIMLERVAKEHNIGRARFISNVLSITQRSAERRLATVKERTVGIEPEFAIMEIKDALEATPRHCPFCAEMGIVTRIPVPINSMCWLHIERFVKRKDFGRYPMSEYEKVLLESNRLYWAEVRQAIDERRAA